MWTNEIPERDGLYWFFGFFDEQDPQLMPVARFNNAFHAVGEARLLKRELFIGMWLEIPFPVPPVLSA